MATFVGMSLASDSQYYATLKSGLLAHLNGNAPQVSIEFARKAIPSHLRPTFYEVEAALENLPPVK